MCKNTQSTVVWLVACLLMSQCCMAIARIPMTPRESWEKSADKLWPRSRAVQMYSRALEQYEAGKHADGFTSAHAACSDNLRIADDGTIWRSPERYYYSYLSGRVRPVVTTMNRVAQHNEEYALQLSERGSTRAALAVLTVNLSMARQMIHLQPLGSDTLPLLVGQNLWRQTWKSVSLVLERNGEADNARSASGCAERALTFTKQRLIPFIETRASESEAFEKLTSRLSKQGKREAYDKRFSQLSKVDPPQIKRMIALWDSEVCDKYCRYMMRLLPGR